MRRYEIDWVRNISILMLFVYHTCAIFTVFGDFYIISEEKNIIANLFIAIMFVWYMPLLFFLAGASTYFASKKRSFKEYLLERIKKLLIPLLFGIVALVPPQTYMARIWRGETNLNYIEHLKYFFSTLTDFSGYDGAFSPAHLWFILYLFIISVIGGFVVYKIFRDNNKLTGKIKDLVFNKYAVLILISIGIISDLFPSIMGKSIIGCLIIFLLGYLVYSDTQILNKIVSNKNKFSISLLFTMIVGLSYIFFIRDNIDLVYVNILDTLLKNMVLIFSISTIIIYSGKYLNKDNKVLKYLNKSAFPVYIIHQPVLLFIAYLIIPVIKSTTLAMLSIIVISLVTTFLIYEIINKIKIFNVLFGAK